jgi:hypothetical protein
MGICKKKFTWNNLQVMFGMTPALFATLRNLCMVLSKAPRTCYAKMDSFLLDTRFSRCHSDPNVYTKKVGNHLIILVLYVDDLILNGSDPKLLNHVKSNLKKKFEMTDLGYLHYFLGLKVLQQTCYHFYNTRSRCHVLSSISW